MSNNNDDLIRSLKLFEGKSAEQKVEKKVAKAEKVGKKEEKLDEFKMKPTAPSKKGMFKGKTKAELRTELSNVKKRMKSIEDSGKKVPKALRTKFSELTFALRAKHDWGTAESKENNKKPMQEAAHDEGSKAMQDYHSGKTSTKPKNPYSPSDENYDKWRVGAARASVKHDKKSKVVKESFNFETAIDKMLAENFWGGEEDGSQDGGSTGMGSAEQGGESPLGNGHEHDEGNFDSDENEHDDVLKIDVPTFIKFLEFAREDSTGDDELHEIAEKLVQCCGEGETINMEKFEELCCMNHDGGEEVGANSDAGQEDHESPDYGNEDSDSGSGEEESDSEESNSESDSGSGDSGSGEDESKSKSPWSVAESMRVLINRLN